MAWWAWDGFGCCWRVALTAFVREDICPAHFLSSGLAINHVRVYVFSPYFILTTGKTPAYLSISLSCGQSA